MGNQRVRIKNLIGLSKNRLTIIEELNVVKYKSQTARKVICKCECGNLKEMFYSHFNRETIKSCGCYNSEIASTNTTKRLTKHGHARSKSNPKESQTYNSWRSMMRRCNVKTSKDYPYYGGIGICVCERWHEFVYFLEDMGERPQDTTIQRVNGKLGYNINNCKWADNDEQSKNREFRGLNLVTKKHRTIYQKFYGVKIKKYNHIHHIDGNHENNNPVNLIELSPKEHHWVHKPENNHLKLKTREEIIKILKQNNI